MTFDQFLVFKEKIASSTLYGMEAHQKLAPSDRPFITSDEIKEISPKTAATLAIIYPDHKNNACIVLTRRAKYNGKHSQQISFPGGKPEKEDASLFDTARREAYEEIGINIDKIKLIKEVSPIYIPPSNFWVHTFLAYHPNITSFSTNHEVDKVISLPLNDLVDDKLLYTTSVYTHYGKMINVPCFKFQDEIIWGATGMILSEIKEIIKNL